jgi:hypothetical protein
VFPQSFIRNKKPFALTASTGTDSGVTPSVTELRTSISSSDDVTEQKSGQANTAFVVGVVITAAILIGVGIVGILVYRKKELGC